MIYFNSLNREVRIQYSGRPNPLIGSRSHPCSILQVEVLGLWMFVRVTLSGRATNLC